MVYGHVLRKEDTDWVKKCMEYEVEGSRPRGRPKRTWREVVQKDCQACKTVVVVVVVCNLIPAIKYVFPVPNVFRTSFNM